MLLLDLLRWLPLSLRMSGSYDAQVLPSRNALERSISFVTYNARYDATPDNISVAESLAALPKGIPDKPEYYSDMGEHPWSTRRLYIANDILFHGGDVLGMQEMLLRQVNDLEELMGPAYANTGVGRDDGKKDGEFSPIFFKREKFSLESNDTFWLSETPFRPSKFRDAGSYRICTTARFALRTKPSIFFTVLNTHLDEQSVEQRRLGASLILHRAKYEAIFTRAPVLLTGDLNSLPDDPAYKILTGRERVVDLPVEFLARFGWTSADGEAFKDFAFVDQLEEVEPRYRLGGNFATFTGFTNLSDISELQRLDYIMAGKTLGGSADYNTISYRVLDNIGDDGVYYSDHRAVISDVHFK